MLTQIDRKKSEVQTNKFSMIIFYLFFYDYQDIINDISYSSIKKVK